MTLSDAIRLVGAYDGGDVLYCVVYFRLSAPMPSPFEKNLRSMTLSKNRFNLLAFVLPVASPRVSWQSKQMTSAPHCSAAKKKSHINNNEDKLFESVIKVYQYFRLDSIP